MTTRLGRYTVLGRLAKGSTADLLLAIPDNSPPLPRRVVLKQLYSHLAGDEEFVRMFVDEVQLMSRFKHDGIVRVFDLDLDNDHFFAVLELTDGPNGAAAIRLHARRGGPGLPVVIAVVIAARVAAALAVVHDLNDVDGMPLSLVHRDVTPDNVLVGRDGAVRLADFGVARSVVGRDSGLLSAKETTAGTRKGKASFLAPEQVLGPATAVSHRADLYALGATLWTLLGGRPPFSRAAGDVALFDAILNTPAPRLTTIIDNTHLDGALTDIVSALLEKRPADRPADAATVAATLRQWCHDHGVDNDVDVVADFVTSLSLPSLAG